MQYIVPEDSRDIPLKDMTGMTMEQADEIMQKMAYVTFDGNDIPMFEFMMVKLPEGYNGFFVHMDHRLIDSFGIVVMINDIMSLYTHYRFGSKYPDDLADFESVLQSDIEKASNEKRFLKDKKFWDDQLDTLGEPLYSDIQGPSVLEASKKKHRRKTLRSADFEKNELMVAVKDYILEPDSAQGLMDFCMNHQLSMTNLLI